MANRASGRQVSSTVYTLLSEAGADFEVVPSKTSSPRSSQAGSSWDTGSSVSETDDMVFHFKQAGIPSADKWARKIHNAGYDLDMLHDTNLDELANELRMPSGIRMRVEHLLGSLRAGEVAGMPSGLDDVPVQTSASDTPWMSRIFFGLALVGAVALIVSLAKQAMRKATFAPALTGPAALPPHDPPFQPRAIATSTRTTTSIAGSDGPPPAAAAAVAGLASLPFWLAIVADCVDGDALITMADRKKKKIRHLKRGEKVLAIHKQKFKVKTVVKVKASENARVYPLEVQNACGERIQVNATGGHPFYAQGKGWSAIAPDNSKFSKPVSKLEKGDKLIMRGGKAAEVLGIGQRTSMPTYNLILDGEGAFFVHDILSHSGLPSLDASAP